MPRLIHLNGPPGIGKSTLAALYADRAPGILNLDVDVVHRLVGGWADENNRTWDLVWPVVHAMAATHLGGGHDVVVPQYHARPDEIATLEGLAHRHQASFHEVILLDGREAAAERFARRAGATDDPWIRHHHLSRARLDALYDDLLRLSEARPDAVVVPSTADAVEATYELLLAKLPL
ncbi:AAA family ATPase [Kribbella sp. NPDC051770]|uniref:AAA family ATPase n=1 Tax=Kribbella sp. NPDC051770 TaxID=3155413 RepID=UPI003414F359